jgi:hypothetical protein
VKAPSANQPRGSETIGRIIADKPERSPGDKAPLQKVKVQPTATRLQRELQLVSLDLSTDSENDGSISAVNGTVTFDNPLSSQESMSARSRKKLKNKPLGEMGTPLSRDFQESPNTTDAAFEDAGRESSATQKKSGGLFGCCGKQDAED